MAMKPIKPRALKTTALFLLALCITAALIECGGKGDDGKDTRAWANSDTERAA